MKNPILLSGVQPSGAFTLGNYLGAIKHFGDLQHHYTSLFCVVDLHALTVRQDPETLRKTTLDTAAFYLACGVDPKKATLFVQSHVPEHTQLAWILSCYTYFGELQRMTQFKDKAQQHQSNINLGLFSYPVLMAADILLYQTAAVPVGDDQTQHLELTRDLADRFNRCYGPTFTLPERLKQTCGARVMSLLDPTKKMSKSCDQPGHVLLLLDDEATIHEKLKAAVTDSETPARIIYDPKRKPGISNLIDIVASLTGKTHPEIEADWAGKGYSTFKRAVAETVVAHLLPLQQRYHTIRQDEPLLNNMLAQGAQTARSYAQKTLAQVYARVGL